MHQMKKRSPSNNKSHSLARSFVLLLVLSGALAFMQSVFPSTPQKALNSYHISAWNDFAPEIDRALHAGKTWTPVPTSHVFGGVVPHHIPTTIPQLVEFYQRLNKTQTVKNFIVIGPDHTDAGKTPVTISNASFFTKYREVKPIEGFAEKIVDAKLAHIEEAPFDPEHSVGAQILLISSIFPDARVTPIILRSDTTRDHAEALARILAENLDQDTVLIASVDFSHYLSTDQALSIDTISRNIIRNLDVGALSLIKADSNRSMEVFVKTMNMKKAVAGEVVVLNTNDLMQNSDYTTGYVFGYWGIEGL